MANMIPEYKERIAIRLSTTQKHEITRLVEASKFKSVSEVIRAALKEFLARFEEEQQ
ncbi:ribbon-helix-helix protein, CopG family [Candidatus Bathyarchaeota archaeon]|nr:ribbon-helix-helix protein, CopG family [Candidatus Bathyarchaeota archaeon]